MPAKLTGPLPLPQFLSNSLFRHNLFKGDVYIIKLSPALLLVKECAGANKCFNSTKYRGNTD